MSSGLDADDWFLAGADAALLGCLDRGSGAPGWVVDPARCGVAPMPSLLGCGLLGSCEVPEPPGPIVELPADLEAAPYAATARMAVLLTALPAATTIPPEEVGGPGGLPWPDSAWSMAGALPAPVPGLPAGAYGPTVVPGIGRGALYVGRPAAPEPGAGAAAYDPAAPGAEPAAEYWGPSPGGGTGVAIYNLGSGAYAPGDVVPVDERDGRWVVGGGSGGTAAATIARFRAPVGGIGPATVVGDADVPASGMCVPMMRSGGNWVNNAGAAEVEVFNSYPGESIPAGARIWAHWIGGRWEALVWSCPT